MVVVVVGSISFNDRTVKEDSNGADGGSDCVDALDGVGEAERDRRVRGGGGGGLSLFPPRRGGGGGGVEDDCRGLQGLRERAWILAISVWVGGSGGGGAGGGVGGARA